MSTTEKKAWEAHDKAWARYNDAVSVRNWVEAERAKVQIMRCANICNRHTRGVLG
jgi:hypothetical protein